MDGKWNIGIAVECEGLSMSGALLLPSMKIVVCVAFQTPAVKT